MSIFLKFIILHLFFLTFFFNFSTTQPNHTIEFEYLKHDCITNTAFPPKSTYKSNLHALLTSLSSHSTIFDFHNTTVAGELPGESIYGMFMCRGDINNQTCQNCTETATQKLNSLCPDSKEAIIWYHECLVRYSNRSIFSTVEEWPRLNYISYNVTTNVTQEGSYGWLLASTLNDAVAEAANGGSVGRKKFATKYASLDRVQNVYTLVQCTPDLMREDCRRCLDDIMRDIPMCCLGSDGGMVLYPSCSLMFGLHQFYRNATIAINWHPLLPTSPDATDKFSILGKERGRLSRIIIVSLPIVTFFICFIAYRFYRKKSLRRYKAILEENFGNESTTLESLQLDLATLQVATNMFSSANLIGKGGFGEVYKGTLPDGREVAVKRLSTTSGQGAIEFKNEVLVIAKLQHRNLVTLLGFCLQEEEKILVYEFVPNKSLDYYLFDPQKQRLLSWGERYKIIGGIARAILYLHEYSRLKIIHRDIKPSNILLDANMNPKISDFGTARIVSFDEDHGRTKRIVGTHGYMSPEYAMLGKFSEKSDSFSFGVMVLEIISGKKNSSSYELYCGEGLLSYAWKQWNDAATLQILDPNLHNNSCCQIEVVRCIQVGLLCVQENPDDRPQMAEVVSYLSNLSIELPFPNKPAFFVHTRMGPNRVAMELDLGSANKSSTAYSNNEMTITTFFPR